MYKQIAANKRNTVIIMAGFVALISLIAAVFAYYYGDWGVLVGTLIIATFYSLLQYFIADKLTVAMAGAHAIEKKDNPRLYNIVENLAITAGLPTPKIYIIDDPAPNAFATGRDPKHSLVAATTGLLDIMDDKELTAVMGHELSHIKNYDIRVSLITFGLVCAVGFIADLGIRMLYFGGRRDSEERSPVGLIIMLITSILAPLVASLAQLAISREREYLADMSSAKLTRYPEGMIAALKKLDTHGRPMRRQNTATEPLYINNPLKKGTLSSLFSTHPSIEKRIARLEQSKTSF